MSSLVRLYRGVVPRMPPLFLEGITDWTRAYEHESNYDARRENIYKALDDAPFQKLVVFAAGMGFLADAYDIFAINMVIPMISYVYWGGEIAIPHGLLMSVLCAALVGAIFGQIAFGILGDLFGRKKMYGWELVITLWATLGLATAADGSNGSMTIGGWLILWRFLIGIGIGGDYPLSAVICSEFAPRRHRSQMLAWLFFMQPVGQLLGTVTALLVTYLYRQQIGDLNTCQDDADCLRAVDRVWRLIIGIGGVPPLIALLFRLTIPESPRYTLEVLQDIDTADKNLRRLFGLPESISVSGSTSSTLQLSQKLGKHPWRVFWSGFHRHFSRNGNWRQLAAIMFSWFALDFAFFGLSMNSAATIRKVIAGLNADNGIYETLLENAWYSLVVVSAGAITGGSILIYVIKRSRPVNIQTIFFVVLGFLLIIVGCTFEVILDKDDADKTKGVRFALTMLYILCQVFFNLGPNSTTFIIPAEQFPAQFRCTCHGLAAASGKFGSVIVQIIILRLDPGKEYVEWEDRNSTWLGLHVIIAFGCIMFLGAFVTWKWVPDSRDANGDSMSLEDLAKGNEYMELLIDKPSQNFFRNILRSRRHNILEENIEEIEMHSEENLQP